MSTSGSSPWSTIIPTTVSGVGTAFFIYVTVAIRKFTKKFMSEHNWLMETTRKNTETIASNTDHIVDITDILADMHGGREALKRSAIERRKAVRRPRDTT